MTIGTSRLRQFPLTQQKTEISLHHRYSKTRVIYLHLIAMAFAPFVDTINTMIFEALKTESPDYKPRESQVRISFAEKKLPENSLPIADWLNTDFAGNAKLEENFAKVVAYIYDRNFEPTSNNFYWSPEEGYSDRVIIPFYYKGKIVGNTARKDYRESTTAG